MSEDQGGMSLAERRGPLQIGEWRVEPALDEMRRGAELVKLEPRMMRLLCLLAERPGNVFSTDEILTKVWPGLVVGQSSVYQAIAQLRRTLGDTGEAPEYIATVPRKGYRIIAPVRRIESLDAGSAGASTGSATPSSGAVTPEVTRDASRTLRTKRLLLGLAVTLAVVVALVALVALTRSETATAEAEPVAIAVLPFSDLSTEGDNQTFCDGLTDEILNSLARVPGLRVTGRTSVFRFRERVGDPQELGRTLGVTHMLEGSVRREDGRLRIAAQLVSTKDGFQVWANSFDRAVAGAIGVQSEISRAVVDSLRIRLSAETRGRLDRGPSASLNAYDLYLLGRNQQLRRTPEALERAVAYHRQAIAADPNFALARAGLADAYMAGYYYQNRPLDETAALVQREVDAALKLDPELAEAHAAWGVLLTEQWRLDDAVAALERAIAINSNYGEAYLRLGAAHEYAGRPRSALEAYDQVLALDPLHTVLHVRRCLTLQNLGRYPEADRACGRAIELQPDIPNAFWARGLLAYAQGDLPGAIRGHEQALTRAPHRADIRTELAVLLLDAGLVERARQELQTARERAGGRSLDVELAAAQVHLASGSAAELGRALRALDLKSADARTLLDAVRLAWSGGDTELAAALHRAALSDSQLREEPIQPGIYAVRWGRCEACAIAALEGARGDPAAARRQLDTVTNYLDHLERNGHRWHGLEYVRANVFAQLGRRADALAALERAHDLGWRRAWLLRTDPALAVLRGDARFESLIERIESANAQVRSTLSAQISTR